jgi:hypothetical protein
VQAQAGFRTAAEGGEGLAKDVLNDNAETQTKKEKRKPNIEGESL